MPQWKPDDLLAMARQYQATAVLVAGADLKVFDALHEQPASVADLAPRLNADRRALEALLDALAALELLEKRQGTYRVPTDVADLLTTEGPNSVLAMVRHQGNCLRRWVQLPWVVLQGGPAERHPSVQGQEADSAAFIEAMDDASRRDADTVVADVDPGHVRHVLDVGGGPGTWSIAWLNRHPQATATLYDLPHVIPIARRHFERAGLLDRANPVVGDMYEEQLPQGADLAWVSAICHMNDRTQNRDLFAKVWRALSPGGRIMIRDIVMDATRTRPAAGAMFAINMLTGTRSGGTFTFDQYRRDLESAGFEDVRQVREDPAMNSVIAARRPQ